MGTFLLLIFFVVGISQLAKRLPGAIRFGMENREAFHGGANLLRGIFRR